MKDELTIKKLSLKNDEVFSRTPLFFNHIHFNKLIESDVEEKLIQRSKRKQAEYSFREPNRLISKIIDFTNLD
jgi:hypothetical protein